MQEYVVQQIQIGLVIALDTVSLVKMRSEHRFSGEWLQREVVTIVGASQCGGVGLSSTARRDGPHDDHHEGPQVMTDMSS